MVPASDGQALVPDLDVDEARLPQDGGHLVGEEEVPAEDLREGPGHEGVEPGHRVVCRVEGVVLGVDPGDHVVAFDPTTGLQVPRGGSIVSKIYRIEHDRK